MEALVEVGTVPPRVVRVSVACSIVRSADGMVQAWLGQKLIKVTYYEFCCCLIAYISCYFSIN
jgi:hypothetical protein